LAFGLLRIFRHAATVALPLLAVLKMTPEVKQLFLGVF
jgi:hypothetical protein